MRLKGPIFAGLLATLVAASLFFWFLSPLNTIAGPQEPLARSTAPLEAPMPEPFERSVPSLQEPDPISPESLKSVQELFSAAPPEAPDPIDSIFKVVDRLIASVAGILGLILTALKIRDTLLEKKKQVAQAAPTPSA